MPPVNPSRIRLLIVLGSLTMFGAMSTDMYLPAFPSVARTLSVTTANVQLTLTAFSFGMGLGQLVYGPISDRFGRKRPLLVGLAVFVGASLLCATATTLPVLMLWRFLQAMGGSAGITIARAMVRDQHSGIDMARMMTAMGVVFAVAPAVAPSLGALILHFGEWQWIFIALAAFGVYTWLGAMTLPESLPPERRTDHGFLLAFKGFAEISRQPEFRRAAIVMCAGSMALFAFISSSPAVLIGRYGMSRTVFALLFGLNSLAMVIASQVNMRLLPRLGVERALRVFAVAQLGASILLVIAIAANAPLPLVLVPLAAATGTVSALFGNGLTLALHPFPHRAASAAALSGLLQMLTAGVIAAGLSALRGNPALHMGMAILLASVIATAFARGWPQSAEAAGPAVAKV